MAGLPLVFIVFRMNVNVIEILDTYCNRTYWISLLKQKRVGMPTTVIMKLCCKCEYNLPRICISESNKEKADIKGEKITLLQVRSNVAEVL